MARIPLGRREFVISKERKKLREKFKDRIARRDRKEARREMARRLDSEALKRAFKQAGIESRKKRKAAEERYFEVKLEAIKKFDPDISEVEATEAAETATLLRVDSAIRRADLRGFSRVRRRGRLINLYQRYKEVKRGRRKLRVRYGPFLSQSTVKRSLAASAYWGRVRALARALGLKESGRDLALARRADRAMLEVPESQRRRIYESVIRKYGR